MFEREDELFERVVRLLRQPARVDPALDERVMMEVAPLRRPGAVASAWRWLVTPRRVALSPLTGLAVATAVAMLVLARPWEALPSAPPPAGDRFQFVFLAPEAGAVALVGDFNDWNPATTPMQAVRPGVWTAVLPLAPGRYRYAFLVNGSEWLADPTAPRAGDDDFGTPSSVVTVGGS